MVTQQEMSGDRGPYGSIAVTTHLLLCSPVINRLWTITGPWPGVGDPCTIGPRQNHSAIYRELLEQELQPCIMFYTHMSIASPASGI